MPKRPTPKSSRYVSTFGPGMPAGIADSKEILGGKGAGLARMSAIGLPVPPGLTITTEACNAYSRSGKFPAGLVQEIERAVVQLGKAMGKTFGDPAEPLLVSVRSGARASMPGMMDTVLNLGLNEDTVAGLAAASGDERFAWDSYRRFVFMYSDVVLGLSEDECPFEAIFAAAKKRLKVKNDTEVGAGDLKKVVRESLALVRKRTGQPFPTNPWEQLHSAVRAVFDSWNNDRAIAYRRMHGYPDTWGTAVNVQAMVFGNLGEKSGTGVAFTRNPATGDKAFYGEYLMNAQGEDVVAGTRTPHPIEDLRSEWPRIYRELDQVRRTLEDHFHDMQDLEFTIENGKLYILQTRNGKRTGLAAVRIATDLVREKRLKKEDALLQIEPDGITQLLSPVFQGSEKEKALKAGRKLATGLNAGPGAATGRIVFTAEEAEAWAARGEQVILARQETSPDDIRGMKAAQGILTQHGGMTSHAALVARQMGKVCVAGCGELEILPGKKTLRAGKKVLREGDWLSLDGTTGEVIEGKIDTRASDLLRVISGKAKPSRSGDDARFRQVMKWADSVRRLRVRANADQPDQARTAVALGAEGIGLCRTEHMFFGEKKLPAMQRMILAENAADRRKALRKILPLQRRDFEGLFRAMGSRPVTIRTLDPPLHEFLPHTEKDIRELSKAIEMPAKAIRARVEALHESNPMLGFRGCRLTGMVPEILEVQITAVFEAAANVIKKGVKVKPEIMIPLVGHHAELRSHVDVVHRIAREVMDAKKVRIPYLVGTMIEVPRAALTADEIAEVAEFFSFGTNDLTQTTLAVSRDDAGSFLPNYIDRGVYERDPFATIDRDGVGKLMQTAVERSRSRRDDIKLGICGEHGGDPSSIEFCHQLGLAYVSCSPYRLPVARLAAAQAKLREA
jgi:pyruvate,orthophosphate dikinase